MYSANGYNLTILVNLFIDHIEIEILYNKCVYDQDYIIRFLDHFQLVLKEMIVNSYSGPRELPIITQKERSLFFDLWRGKSVDLSLCNTIFPTVPKVIFFPPFFSENYIELLYSPLI